MTTGRWGRLEVGRKIGGGGQADISEALWDGKVEEGYVLKVFRSDYSLADLQRQWVTRSGNMDKEADVSSYAAITCYEVLTHL